MAKAVLDIPSIFEKIERRKRNLIFKTENVELEEDILLYAKRQLIILQKDNFRCVLCKKKNNLTIDHIKPLRELTVRRGTADSLDPHNCRILCTRCHMKRNYRDEIAHRKFVNSLLIWEQSTFLECE